MLNASRASLSDGLILRNALLGNAISKQTPLLCAHTNRGDIEQSLSGVAS